MGRRGVATGRLRAAPAAEFIVGNPPFLGTKLLTGFYDYLPVIASARGIDWYVNRTGRAFARYAGPGRPPAPATGDRPPSLQFSHRPPLRWEPGNALDPRLRMARP